MNRIFNKDDFFQITSGLSSNIHFQEKALEALFAISDAIVTYPKTKSLIINILEIIRNLFNASTAIFWSLNPEKLSKCWEKVECGKVTCPAYGNDDLRCWSIPGTLCRPEQGSTESFEEKMPVCFQCPVLLDAPLTFEALSGIEYEYPEKDLTVGTTICRDLFLHKPPIVIYHTIDNNGELVCYKQVECLPRHSPNRPRLVESEGCLSLKALLYPSTKIGLGLLTKHQLTGIICLTLDSVYYLYEEDLSLLMNIARITSVAIENHFLNSIMDKKNKRILKICKDAHHRIKNNLQILSSLFLIQLQHCQDPATKSILMDNLIRVRGISYVHQLLSREDGATVNLTELCEKILESGFQILNIENKFLNYFVSGSTVFIDSRKATSLAIILNELLTNSIKHGFKDRFFGRVNVKIRETVDNSVILEFCDNGRGFVKGFDIDKHTNLGLKIVLDIVKEDLNGDIKIESDNGSKIIIKFKL